MYKIDTMFVDDLAARGARASAAVLVLTQLSGNIPV